MEWNNVKMTKEEIERKQKEYIKLAMEMSRKAGKDETIRNYAKEISAEVITVPSVPVNKDPYQNTESAEAIAKDEQKQVSINENTLQVNAQTEDIETTENNEENEAEYTDVSEDNEYITSSDNEEISNADNYVNSDNAEEIFANVFLSEEEAEEKAEKAARIKESTEIPSFENYIENHNKSSDNISNSDKSANNSAMKGGQNHN